MGYNYNQGGMGMPPAPVQTSTNAVISLIAGIVGLFFLPLIGSIVALITGNAAKKEIANSGGAIGGQGLAQAGVIMGWIGLILWGLTACIVISIFVITFILTGALIWQTESFLPLILSVI
jgi:hypothetical protein